MSQTATNSLWTPSHHPSCTCGDCILHILENDTCDFSIASQSDESKKGVVSGPETGITKSQPGDRSGVNELDASIPDKQEAENSGANTVQDFKKETDEDSFAQIYLNVVLVAMMCLVGFGEA